LRGLFRCVVFRLFKITDPENGTAILAPAALTDVAALDGVDFAAVLIRTFDRDRWGPVGARARGPGVIWHLGPTAPVVSFHRVSISSASERGPRWLAFAGSDRFSGAGADDRVGGGSPVDTTYHDARSRRRGGHEFDLLRLRRRGENSQAPNRAARE